MIFVLSFVIPDAIAGTQFELNYSETMERIDAVSNRAIAGHTEQGKTPRDKGSRQACRKASCHWTPAFFKSVTSLWQHLFFDTVRIE